MSEESVTIENRKYLTASVLIFGDYGGAGDIGLANIRTILRTAKHESKSVFETDFGSLNYAERETVYFPMEGELDLRAAIKSENPPSVLHVTGSHGSEQIYVLESEDCELCELVYSLSDYPCLDDDESSNIQIQWEDEAWESWIKSDLERAIGYGHTMSDDEDKLYDQLDHFELYRQSMDECNEYPISEHSGVYVNVDRIAPRYIELARAAMAQIQNSEGSDYV